MRSDFVIETGSGFGRPFLALGVVAALASIAGPAAGQTISCLPIRKIDVSGAESLSVASVRRAVAPFEGRCLGLPEFNAALKAVTELYIEAGFITSRVYLPEQDLSTGVLRLAAVEGRIEAVQFNGQRRQLWEQFTFPGIRDRVADLREIEQGLDNIRSMPSYHGAKMTLDAGSKPGLSVLQVSAQPDPKPWRLSFSTDNYGFEGDGEFNPTVSLGWDNLFGMNDSWDFSYTSAVDQAPFAIGEPGQSSQQAVIGVTIPYGRWSYSLRQSWSAYETEIPGAVSPIPADGDSIETSLRAKRLLDRDETSKTHVAFDLTRSRKRNNIAGVRIETSSRVLTWLGAELAHQRAWRGGQLSGTLRFEQGIRALGAEDAGTQPAGQPDAQYSLIMLKADYEKTWALSSGPGRALTWISTAKLQYSPDRLYGGQQFLLGGNATVRGSKISLAEGSSGAFWRNELWYHLRGPKQDGVFAAWLGYPVLYAGLDAGRVFAQGDIDVPGGSALGGTLGLRLSGGRLSFDLGYAKVLAVSDRLQKPEGHLRMAFGLSF